MDSTSDPRAVKRVSMNAIDFTKTVPPFINQHGSDDDKRLTAEALHISIAIRVLLGQFFLYTALTRSKDFTRACNESEAKDGVAIVVGSLMRTMVVGIAALFDDDTRTNNIPKMLKMALNQERSEFLFATARTKKPPRPRELNLSNMAGPFEEAGRAPRLND